VCVCVYIYIDIYKTINLYSGRVCHFLRTKSVHFFATWSFYINFSENSQSYFMVDSQYVLALSPLCGRLTRYCFLFKSLDLEFVVLSLWGTLSDDRPGLSFVSHSLVICLCVHLLVTE
jgi:hypothetical protein